MSPAEFPRRGEVWWVVFEPSIGGNSPWRNETDLEFDTCDSEPSLGWSNQRNQTCIALESTFHDEEELDYHGGPG